MQYQLLGNCLGIGASIDGNHGNHGNLGDPARTQCHGKSVDKYTSWCHDVYEVLS